MSYDHNKFWHSGCRVEYETTYCYVGLKYKIILHGLRDEKKIRTLSLFINPMPPSSNDAKFWNFLLSDNQK